MTAATSRLRAGALSLACALSVAAAVQPWLSSAAWAQAPAAMGGFAEPSTAMPQPPEIAARAFILQDLNSRQTLSARNADQTVEPASLTKLMTA